MMALTTKRNCPNCGLEVKNSKLEVEAKYPAETLTANQLQDFFVGFRKDQCFFTYFRCTCGLLWCPEYFHQEALDDLYRSIPENNLVSGKKDSQATQIGYAELLFRITKVQSPILEVGADVGELIGAIKDRSPEIQGYAIEPNTKVLDQLESRLGTSKNIYPSLLLFPKDIKPRLILAIHVIDHLINPREFFEGISEISSGQCEFFIVVHNEVSLLRRIMQNRWAPFCLQHPQLFNPKTLAEILRSSGFKHVSNKKTFNWIAPKQVAHLLETISILPRGTSKFIPSKSIPIKLGNFAMLAKK
jgi:hypothetical protein